MSRASLKRQGPRPKHLPMRTCIACRQGRMKREMVRIVRTPDGDVEIDLTGKKSGRGAYLCQARACWESALKKNTLAHALETEIDAEVTQKFQEFSRRLPEPQGGTVS